ncbi:NADH:flavin oxidoreductase/NADH oxidase [Sporosarcina sp. FSL W8-0480]|uniref:NADH:flavin oxidoreductase/NADH oxidase n=1 Tax=Sporosarcina sp. FSL W8-0480 TaxID=2954701 RepID=UPI0030D70E26
MAKLFEPYKLKNLELRNRVVLSPMCQYKAENQSGEPNKWHLIHLVSRAIGGTGLIMTEMVNVEPRGRITENCLGIYSDVQRDRFKEINEEIHKYGAKTAIQIAHAGRKSTIKGGDLVAPSSIPFSDGRPTPRELKVDEIHQIIERFAEGAKRAVEAGFDAIELHGAHGYLMHQFISPISNKRSDEYGHPSKFSKEVIEAVKSEMPSEMPLILRISAREYHPDGYDFTFMKKLIPQFIDCGVDILDVSTGGNSIHRPHVYPGYQSSYSNEIRNHFNVPTISVGELRDPKVAEMILQEGMADLISIGKGQLRHPYWAKEAAVELGVELEMPGEYNLGY